MCRRYRMRDPNAGRLDPQQLNVTVTAPVPTFFMRVLGIKSVQAARTAKAVYIQKFPMGSPLNYYGVYQDCKVSGTTITCTNLPNANGVGTLASQGFFGAIEGQGANRPTGDAFATAYNSDPTANDAAHSGGLIVQQYDPNGLRVPDQGARQRLDPVHLRPDLLRDDIWPGGGHLGAGDHWLSTTNYSAPVAASTYFRSSTRRTRSSRPRTTGRRWPIRAACSRVSRQVDKSAAYALASAAGGADKNFSEGTEPTRSRRRTVRAGPSLRPCPPATPLDNRRWPMATGLPQDRAAPGHDDRPRNPTRNQAPGLRNMWSLEVVGGGAPTIAGSGRMVTDANIGRLSGSSTLLDRTGSGAGKTLKISFFPGRCRREGLAPHFIAPMETSTHLRAFNWTADSYDTSPRTMGGNQRDLDPDLRQQSAIRRRPPGRPQLYVRRPVLPELVDQHHHGPAGRATAAAV